MGRYNKNHVCKLILICYFIYLIMLSIFSGIEGDAIAFAEISVE